MAFQGNSVPEFVSGGTSCDEIPGCLVPALPLAVPTRRTLLQCATAGTGGAVCPKAASHKGWRSFGLNNQPPREIETFLIKQNNDINKAIEAIKGALLLMMLTTQNFPDYEWTILNGICLGNHDLSLVLGPWTVTGVSGGTVSATYDETNDPADATIYDFNVTLAHWGILEFQNSKLSGKKYICTGVRSNSTGGIFFDMATPMFSRAMTSSNGSPVTCSLRVLQPLADLAFPGTRDVLPLMCVQDTWTHTETAATTYTILTDGLAALSEYHVEKQDGADWVAITGTLKNIPGATAGTHDVTVDLAASGLTGTETVRVRYWKEKATDEGTSTATTWTQTPPVSQDNVIASGKRALPIDNPSYTVQIMYWDSDEVWIDVPEGLDFGTLQNVASGDFYDVHFDTSYVTAWEFTREGDTEPTTIDGVQVLYTLEDTPPALAHNKCQDRCGNSVWEITGSVGVTDPVTSRKYFCSQWSERSEAEKAHYKACGGRCNNGNCEGRVMDSPTFPLDAIQPLIWDRPYLHEQEQEGYDKEYSWRFSREGGWGLDALAGGDLNATGLQYKKKEWFYGCQYPWGRIKHTYNEETGQTLVGLDHGLEFVVGASNDYGAGGGLVGRLTSHGNQAATDGNDPSKHYQGSITNGLVGRHKYTGAIMGTPTRCIRFRDTVLLFPLIGTDATQHFLDGKVTLGYWTADGTPQDAEDGNTAYRMMVQLTGGVRSYKLPNEIRNLETVKSSVQIYRVLSRASGVYSVALLNGWTQIAKHGGTGEPDVETSLRMAGANVLWEHGARPANWACHESIEGAAAWGYIYTGMAFEVPEDPDIPKRFWGRLIPVSAVRPGDIVANVTDPNWDASKVENVTELPPANRMPLCDTADLADVESTLADMEAAGVTLANVTWQVKEGYWATGSWVWKSSGPEESDTTL